MIDGHARIRAALVEHLAPEHTPDAFTLTDLFAAELGTYAELIAGPGARPIGFMTHGEGPQFTERVRIALASLGMPAEARAHHLALAQLFEHTRGFFKAEWADGEPLAAIYFRRRPEVSRVVEHLALPAHALTMANALEKDTVHFVAAAFRVGQPLHHKLYFSQWVTPDTRAAVVARLGRVLALYGVASPGWSDHHERSIAGDDATIFVSMSCSAAGVTPSFKIDYPEVSAEIAAAWVPPEARPQVVADARRVQALAGTREVSYLGVRFAPDRAPALKYYADVPGSV